MVTVPFRSAVVEPVVGSGPGVGEPAGSGSVDVPGSVEATAGAVGEPAGAVIAGSAESAVVVVDAGSVDAGSVEPTTGSTVVESTTGCTGTALVKNKRTSSNVDKVVKNLFAGVLNPQESLQSTSLMYELLTPESLADFDSDMLIEKAVQLSLYVDAAEVAAMSAQTVAMINLYSMAVTEEMAIKKLMATEKQKKRPFNVITLILQVFMG